MRVGEKAPEDQRVWVVVVVVCEYLDLRPGNGGVQDGHTYRETAERPEGWSGVGVRSGAASEVWMGKPKLA